MSKRSSRWLVIAIAGSMALVAAIGVNTRRASAFGWDGLDPLHERITRNAFPFLAGSVLDRIVDGNLDEDQGDEADLAERHGVNCRFRDGAAYVNMRYRQVVAALREPWPSDPNRAARLFGHILHGVQDFYSHSNWIPTPPEGLGIRGRLFESGLGLWPALSPYSVLFDDVVIIEGNPPAGVTARLPVNANGRVSSAVPIVEDRRIFATVAAAPVLNRTLAVGSPASSVVASTSIFDVRRSRGLMTAGAPRHPGDQLCPQVGASCEIESAENVCLRHGDKRSSDTSSRNYEGAGRMNLDGGGGGDWFQARHYAKEQSQHEWCRLLHLSRDLDPSFVASGRLLGNWVGTDSGTTTPHIPGTPCARGAARRHLVEISATPEANAPLLMPFVVFRSDFTSSARTTVLRQTTRTLRICGDTNESIVASLMPAQTEGATFVVSVPGVARSWTVRDHRGAFAVTFVITVTPNAC